MKLYLLPSLLFSPFLFAPLRQAYVLIFFLNFTFFLPPFFFTFFFERGGEGERGGEEGGEGGGRKPPLLHQKTLELWNLGTLKQCKGGGNF